MRAAYLHPSYIHVAERPAHECYQGMSPLHKSWCTTLKEGYTSSTFLEKAADSAIVGEWQQSATLSKKPYGELGTTPTRRNMWD